MRRAALPGGATPGLRAGIASHNLFDVAWALLVARDHGVADRIEIEMLQGIATPQARVVRDAIGGLRLYSPVVTAKDFDVAISYLFRRLEENTAPENYLHHAFSLLADSPQFDEEVARFRMAVAERHAVYAGVRRAPAEPADADFNNEPDSDPSLVTTQRWITGVRDLAVQPVPRRGHHRSRRCRRRVRPRPRRPARMVGARRRGPPGDARPGRRELAARRAASSSPRWRRRPPRSTPRATPR